MRHRGQASHRDVLVALALVLVVAGCSKGKDPAAGGGFEMPPMPVEVATATRGTVTERYEAVGTIEASRAAPVVAEIEGVVVDVPFREGSPIRSGGLIARLDDKQLRAEMDRASALRDQSQLNFDRMNAVVEQGAGAPQDLDDARAALQVADANLALAKARFDKTRIVAPFDGIAGVRRVSPGEYVRPGQPITEIADLHEFRVTFMAPERFLPSLQRGAGVTVSTSAVEGQELTGKIAAVEPVLDTSTRSAHVVAIVPNTAGVYRPGMSARVSAVLAERENAITIPSEAVFFEGNQALVYMIKPDGTVARTPLTLGTRLPDAVEVLSGLEPGTQVVRTGHQKLFDGAKVMPAGAGAPGAPGGPGGAPGAPGAAPGGATPPAGTSASDSGNTSP